MMHSRTVQRANSLPEKKKPYEVGLEYFTKINAPEVVQLPSDLTGKLTSSQIIFRDKGSNMVLACAYTHISNAIRQRQHSELETDVIDLLHRQPLELSRTPEQFEPFLHPETIAGTVLAGLNRVEKAARSHQYSASAIQFQLGQLLNTCPFFKFCVVYWVRLKALALLAEEVYPEALGNEYNILSSYQSEPRGFPLELLCRSLSLQLELICGSHYETYNYGAGNFCEQFEVRRAEIFCNCWEPDNRETTCGSESVLGQSMAKSITDSMGEKGGKNCAVCPKVCCCTGPPRRLPLTKTGTSNVTVMKTSRLGSGEGPRLP